MVRILAAAFGLGFGVLWLIIWWAGALNTCPTCSRYKVLLDFNGSGEAVLEGIALHLVMMLLALAFVRTLRGPRRRSPEAQGQGRGRPPRLQRQRP